MATPSNHHRVDYLEFSVTDVAAAKKFYGRVFGWKLTDYGPDYASFEDGRLAGGFSKVKRVKRGGPLIVLYSKELEKTQKKIVAAGGKIVKKIFDFPGGRRLHFTDPGGNELAVWSEPA